VEADAVLLHRGHGDFEVVVQSLGRVPERVTVLPHGREHHVGVVLQRLGREAKRVP
jgi:hypothetical protein